jgi:hypothetical protein
MNAKKKFFTARIEYVVRDGAGNLETRLREWDVTDCINQGSTEEDLLENGGWKLLEEIENERHISFVQINRAGVV